MPHTRACALSGTRGRCPLAKARHQGQCWWAGTVPARPRPLRDPWAVPGCVFYVTLGPHRHSRQQPGRFCCIQRDLLDGWVRVIPGESPGVAWRKRQGGAAERSCLAGGGYPTQPASAPPPPPLPTARHNTAIAHLLPSPGSPLGDSFQLSELNGDMFFPCPGFIVWLSPTHYPAVPRLSHHPVRPWVPSQSQGCCSPACPLVAHGSASGLGGQEELAKNQNISPELGFGLDPDAWTHGTTSGQAPVPSRTVHMPQSGQAQPPLGTTAAQRSHRQAARVVLRLRGG